MIRILLALDDFSELSQLEMLFRKVGFDVDGISKKQQFTESYLGLNPKLIIASNDPSISGIELFQKVSRRDGFPKLILNTPRGQKVGIKDLNGVRIDYIFESPMNPILLIKKICQLTEIDYLPISEKLEKIKGQLASADPGGLLDYLDSAEEDKTTIKGPRPGVGLNLRVSSLSEEERLERNAKFLAKTGKIDKSLAFEKNRVSEFKKVIRAEEGEDDAILNVQRIDFVNTMFEPDDDDENPS